jgi:hypothetical protein
MPIYLVTGCGDLEPEMQDTRTVILKMDFDQRSSSRTSSFSHVDLSNYKTHLIIALPSGKTLTNNYNDFYDDSSFAQGLMKADKTVRLEIPLNKLYTEMKIFAFLFQENYNSLPEFLSGTRTLGYYGESTGPNGESRSFYILDLQAPLDITLIQVPGTDPDGDTETGGGSTDTFTELEGTWKTACYTDSVNYSNYFTHKLAGNDLTITEEQHSDTSCATDYSLQEKSHTFSVGDDAGKILITLGSTIKRTPQSASAVSSYNSSSNCGYSDWELNTAKDCTNEDAGDPIYCFYQLNGNTLYVECNESSYPTTSDIDTSDASSTFVKQ